LLSVLILALERDQCLKHRVSLAATNAFLRGLTIGALVAGGVAAAGAIMAVLFLPAQPVIPALAEPSSNSPDPVALSGEVRP
jgi:hypothetical protein